MEPDVLEHRPLVYLAAPLFSAAELDFNARLKRRLSPYVSVFLPQEDGGLLADLVSAGADPAASAKYIFDVDVQAIRKSDALIIVLDGRTIDEGACFELGYAHAIGKPCVGLQTDVRRMLETRNNPMVDVALKAVFHNIEDLLLWIQDFAHVQNRVATRVLTI